MIPADFDPEHISYRPFLNRDRNVRIFDVDLRNCETLGMLFRIEGFITSFFTDAEAFTNKANTATDVLVANFHPLGDGAVNLVSDIKTLNRRTVIIGLIEEPDVRLAVDLMRAGATDVLARPFDTERLLTSVREELRRDIQLGVSCEGERTIVVQGFNTLTQREREVLQLIVDGQSNKRAAKTLGISPRTVEVHRGRIMEKLGATNTADLLRIVLTR